MCTKFRYEIRGCKMKKRYTFSDNVEDREMVIDKLLEMLSKAERIEIDENMLDTVLDKGLHTGTHDCHSSIIDSHIYLSSEQFAYIKEHLQNLYKRIEAINDDLACTSSDWACENEWLSDRMADCQYPSEIKK